MQRQGPLTHVKIVEFAGIGPGPHAAMMLADMGAEVIRIVRKGDAQNNITDNPANILLRSRPAIALDLKDAGDREIALTFCDAADGLIEGFRPQVMERLGFAPDVLLARNPKLVYGRMTGWGQAGPLALAAGHDLNYIAITGALHAMGAPHQAPLIPLNLLGDFGGGSTYLAMGMLAAMLEARHSGKGQVVDAAICDGVVNLSAFQWGLMNEGQWTKKREDNFLDGAAHFYNIYGCSDGKYISLAPIEPQFYALFREKLQLNDQDFAQQFYKSQWPHLREKLQGIFARKTRDEWCRIFEGTDVCFAPVLDWDDAKAHPHQQARGNFIEIEGATHTAPAPRFSGTPSAISQLPSMLTIDDALAQWGLKR